MLDKTAEQVYFFLDKGDDRELVTRQCVFSESRRLVQADEGATGEYISRAVSQNAVGRVGDTGDARYSVQGIFVPYEHACCETAWN